MAMALTSTSHASTYYHVFLSFRGEDTRLGFIGHLYKALIDMGIHTFIDDEELQRGEEITPALVQAIQYSRIAITVLSKDYASSSFCLDELATIIHCKSKGLLVLPVFYMVDPSDVRHQRGSYGEAFANHERRFKHNMDKLQKWKEALHQVADLSGYHFKEGYENEYKFIGSIVHWVLQKINHPARLQIEDYLVGLESRVAEVMQLLDVGCDDVLMIGIHGMGGVGKSTLARVVYNNLIAEKFDGSCFLENVREKSNKHGLEHLQNVLLQETFGDKNVNIASWQQGASVIEDRLQQKKVLLVLDDVDKYEQLQAIVGSPYWFGPGSRVIITTRDIQLLKCHEVERRYQVTELNENDALKLLTWKAFKKEEVELTYAKVLYHVLSYASGLPLALEVIGSDLFGKSVKDWESAINQYKRIPHNRIQDILKVSFDNLQEEEKSVFLDIACCFEGYELQEVELTLSTLYGDNVEYHIGVLIDKSLIKVNKYSRVFLHDLIRDMGRQIDQKDYPNTPEKRMRLWLAKDIIEVLQDNMGTRKIEIIYLHVPISDKHETIEWDGNAFKEMKRLKILIIKNGKFSQGPKCLPKSLRVLEWWGYPSHCLPSDFQPTNLVICKLPNGCFTSFGLIGSSKMFENLIVLNFDWCRSLTQIPDISDLSNLEILSFHNCYNLITVHESIGHLAKVKEIMAHHCRNLVSFPPIHLTSLETLDLSHCKRLESFPEILGKMENIRNLRFSYTPIKELPISFGNLIGLEYLSMDECGSVQLSSSILMMPELTYFEAENCKGMKWAKQQENEETMGSVVPSTIDFLCIENSNLDDDFFLVGFTRFAHVEYLNLSGNNFTFLPECIKEFQSLWYLNVSDCKHLQEIGGVPPNLIQFIAKNCKSLTSSTISMFINQELYETRMLGYCCLPGVWIPDWFDHQSIVSGLTSEAGPSSSFWVRNKFPDKILCLQIATVEFNKGYVYNPMVLINGKVQQCHIDHGPFTTSRMEMDHTYLFELDLNYSEYKVAFENERNHVEVRYANWKERSVLKAIRIHVFKGESSVEDFRLTDNYPCTKRKLDNDLNSFKSHNRRLLKRCQSVEMEVSWSSKMKWACNYFHLFLLNQSSHCIIM